MRRTYFQFIITVRLQQELTKQILLFNSYNHKYYQYRNQWNQI